MTIFRRAAKVDTTQAPIVEALRRAGWCVWLIRLPVDLLLWRPEVGFRLMEAKTPYGKSQRAVIRKSQKDQNDFIELTGVPRVTSVEQALEIANRWRDLA